MPIPINTEPLSILGSGARMPVATPQDFGSETGAALQGLGNELGQSGQVVAKLANQRKLLENAKWVNDSMSSLRDYYSKWMADPNNHTSENYDENLKNLMTKSLDQYSTAAPSQLAKQQFREEFQHFSSSRYESATQATSATKIKNVIRSITDGTDSIMDSYRKSRETPALDANVELLNNIKMHSGMIDQLLGTIAPEHAKQLKDQLTIDGTYAALEVNPELATRVLNMGSLEGRTRHVLEDQIKASNQSNDAVNQVVLDQIIQNKLALAKSGKDRENLSLSDISPYFSRDNRHQAEALVVKVNDKIDRFNRANDVIAKISPWNPNAQAEALMKMSDDIGKDPKNADRDSDVLQIAHEQILHNITMAKKDPAGYLISNNPIVKSAYNRLQDSNNQVTRSQYRNELDDLLKKYQGPTPTDVSGDEAKMFHNVPRKEVSLMSEAEAEHNANLVNGGSPGDALNTIQQIVQQHPREDDQAIAFNDMVKLPESKRIRGEYWAAYINRNQPWIKDYVGAIQSAGALLKNVDSKVVERIDSEITANKLWKTFSSIIPADNFQREGIVQDFRNGIKVYSLALAQKNGVTPEKAVSYAATQLLDSEMHPTIVAGQRLMITRDQGPNLPPRTDADIAELGRKLDLAPKLLDPREIKLTGGDGRKLFPELESIGNDMTKNQVLIDKVSRDGFFQPSSDGRSATLYIRNGIQSPIELHDKNNKAFQIDLKDLPDFMVTNTVTYSDNPYRSQIQSVSHAINKDIAKPLVDKTHPISDALHMLLYGHSPWSIRNFDTRTNWPVTPDWMKRSVTPNLRPIEMPSSVGGGEENRIQER